MRRRISDLVSISTAASITGVQASTLRYWEKELAPHLCPFRGSYEYRYYRPEDIQMVFVIKQLLRDEMFSLAGAKRYLDNLRRINANS